MDERSAAAFEGDGEGRMASLIDALIKTQEALTETARVLQEVLAEMKEIGGAQRLAEKMMGPPKFLIPGRAYDEILSESKGGSARFIPTIKAVRNATGWGLKATKDFVDQFRPEGGNFNLDSDRLMDRFERGA
jgi:ribosomal protein L7/L12